MPYIPVNFVLPRELSHNVTIDIPYPKGKAQGSFFGAFNHTISINASFFRAPADFIVIPEKEKILLKWTNPTVHPAGEIANLHLEEIGMDFFFDERTGVTLKNAVPAPLFLVSFKSPHLADKTYYLPPTLVKSSGSLPLKNLYPDVTRSVVIYSPQDNSNRVFKIEGEDPYFRSIIEEVKGPNGGFVETNKTFTKISRVIVSGECNGEVHIGTGNKLGFPVFLPAAPLVMRIVFDGREITDGTIIPGDIMEPTASSGDRRGIYIPTDNIKFDGNAALYMLIALPNPGNIGSPDYVG